jgi:hypothetical protein
MGYTLIRNIYERARLGISITAMYIIMLARMYQVYILSDFYVVLVLPYAVPFGELRTIKHIYFWKGYSLRTVSFSGR